MLQIGWLCYPHKKPGIVASRTDYNEGIFSFAGFQETVVASLTGKLSLSPIAGYKVLFQQNVMYIH